MSLATSAKHALTVFDDGAPTSDSMLSVYLDTSVTRIIDRAYLGSFRANAKELRSAITLKDTANLEAAESAISLVEAFLTDEFKVDGPGVAIFANKDRVVEIAQLPFRPEEALHWGPRPVIQPLREALDEFERIAVVLFDLEQTRYFSIFLGEIEHKEAFTDDVPGKQATGGWYGLSQKNYQRHHDDRVLKHAKRTAALLGSELSVRPFDRLFLAGPDEAVAVLRHHLPKRIAQRLAGALGLEHFATDSEILAAALVAGEQAEFEREIAEVDALFENRTDHVVLGPENTFQALYIGRVDRLFVASDVSREVGKCVECGRLTGLDPCPVCTGVIAPAHDAVEEAIELAVRQGARIEMVNGAAGTRLLTAGGFAAWTRRSER